MADQKISQLTDGTSFQAGDEAVVNRSGTNFKVDPTQFAELDVKGGDVSFYEDTGTTPKFFWDASEEYLGIGTSSPFRELEITGTGNVYARITAPTASDSTALELVNTGETWTIRNDDTNSDALEFGTSGGTHLTIDTSGSVGIGTSSPNRNFHVVGDMELSKASGNAGFRIVTSATSEGYLIFGDPDDNSMGGVVYDNVTNSLHFDSNNAERVRIDSSGNLLVGQSSSTNPVSDNIEGVSIQPGGQINASVDGGVSANFNRITSDGDIVRFRKDGSTVGSIGTTSSEMTIGSAETGIRFNTPFSQILPHNISTNTSVDDAISIGSASKRFKDLYLSGGVYLGGTGAANLLDDYETGTWTPTVEGSSTAGTYTLSGVVAYYTKIGNQVTVWASFGFSAASGGSGDFRLSGLPFNYKASSAINASPRISGVNTGEPNAINVVINQNSSSSSDTLSLVAILDNAAREFVSITGFSTSSSMTLSVTYTVS